MTASSRQLARKFGNCVGVLRIKFKISRRHGHNGRQYRSQDYNLFASSLCYHVLMNAIRNFTRISKRKKIFANYCCSLIGLRDFLKD